jgi:hypothetical protein
MKTLLLLDLKMTDLLNVPPHLCYLLIVTFLKLTMHLMLLVLSNLVSSYYLIFRIHKQKSNVTNLDHQLFSKIWITLLVFGPTVVLICGTCLSIYIYHNTITKKQKKKKKLLKIQGRSQWCSLL